MVEKPVYDEPATVMLSAPTLPFAEKLTTFRPNAMQPLRRRTTACVSGMPPMLYAWLQLGAAMGW